MNSATNDDPDREARLHAVLLECLEAVQEGRIADRRNVLTQHPEFAAELREFFALREQIDRLAAPLRDAALSGVSAPKAAPAQVESASPSPAPSELGQIGEFRLLREIGRGGMGVVYEAHQTSLNRRVALKVLPFAAALDPKQLQRFQNEAQAAAQLHHTNIVPVHAVGHERGVHYYAMQLIEGQSLAALIEELRQQDKLDESLLPATSGASAGAKGRAPADEPTGPYSPLPSAPEARAVETAGPHAAAISTDRSTRRSVFFRRVAQLGMKAAEALEHAHQAGVIHRDIKPANLLVDVRGNLWITDFGLALFQTGAGLTMTGELLGTLRYMSPEQAWARRGEVNHRTDIYSLGVTLYELLTLRPVFDGQDRQELLYQIAYQEPREPRRVDRAIPVELETIVLKAIAKSPAERYATAQDLADDLQRFLDDKPILAKRPSLRERAVKWTRRHRSLVASAVVLMLVIMIGSVASTIVIAHAHAQTKEALQREQDRADEVAFERERAERSFQQARRAVDFFKDSAQELPNWPQLQAVRLKLLKGALQYYREFIDQHADDAFLQQELVASISTVADLLNELEGEGPAFVYIGRACAKFEEAARNHPGDPRFQIGLAPLHKSCFFIQAGGGTFLLTQKAVADDLQLSDEQRAKVDELMKQLDHQRRQVREEFQNLGPSDEHRRIDQMFKDNRRAVADILQPAQAKRLKEIDWQVQGPMAFGNPEVMQRLQLTDAQRSQISQIHMERMPCPDFGRGPDHRRPPPPPPDDAREETLARIMSVLDADQKTKWQRLTGEPFRGELHLGPPPGYRPH